MIAIRRSRYVKMTLEEEYNLITDAKIGKQYAIDAIVKNNEGLIHKYLRKFKCKGNLEYNDLFQTVNLPADYCAQFKEGKIIPISSDSIDNVCNEHGDTFADFFFDDQSLDWELQIESNDRMNMLLECLEWVDEMPRKLIMEIIVKGRPVKDVCAEYGLRVDTQRDYVISGLEELKVPLRKLYGIKGLKECME